jgi:hypothetical protein
VQRKIGPASAERRRPAAGYLGKRTAWAWLRDLLDQAGHGALPGTERTGATFAGAAAKWLRYVKPRYLHNSPRDEDAALVAEAVALKPTQSVAQRLQTSSPITRDDQGRLAHLGPLPAPTPIPRLVDRTRFRGNIPLLKG